MARAVAVFTEAIKSYGRVSSRSMDSTLGGLLVEAGTFLGFWQSSIQSVQLHQLFYSLRLAKYCSVQKPSSNLISANSGDIHRETNLSMTIVMITGSAGLIGSESNRIDSSLIVKEVTKQSVLIAASISLFGASKVVADVLVQEQERYFGMKAAVFRGGCLTSLEHSGTQMHGFLPYLMKCTMLKKSYEVYGYKGKQVRDNIYSYDLVNAFYHFYQATRIAEVHNMGGGRFSNCSMLEALQSCEETAQKRLSWSYVETNRSGDHIWWISSVQKFKQHYPEWQLTYTTHDILKEIFVQNTDRWL